jgi:hypothetical protein
MANKDRGCSKQKTHSSLKDNNLAILTTSRTFVKNIWQNFIHPLWKRRRASGNITLLSYPPEEEPMERVNKFKYQGKEIILIDLSNTRPEETLSVLPIAEKLITACAQKSALVLTDVTNSTYNKEVAEGIKGFVRTNTPHIKASAVVGAEGVRGILLSTVIYLTRREIKKCHDRPSAMDWLAGC